VTDGAGGPTGIGGWVRRRWWIFSTYHAEGFPYSLVRLMSTASFKDHGASFEAVGLTCLIPFLPLLEGEPARGDRN
jgi:hypothetical protein